MFLQDLLQFQTEEFRRLRYMVQHQGGKGFALSGEDAKVADRQRGADQDGGRVGVDLARFILDQDRLAGALHLAQAPGQAKILHDVRLDEARAVILQQARGGRCDVFRQRQDVQRSIEDVDVVTIQAADFIRELG